MNTTSNDVCVVIGSKQKGRPYASGGCSIDVGLQDSLVDICASKLPRIFRYFP